mmetsp:Transcript_11474/g.23403  ORF Transcript_11474/g.23403 Transcript_11474/m.23403 type:complete len:176 (+) Transcript_11474:152-679(+)
MSPGWRHPYNEGTRRIILNKIPESGPLLLVKVIFNLVRSILLETTPGAAVEENFHVVVLTSNCHLGLDNFAVVVLVILFHFLLVLDVLGLVGRSLVSVRNSYIDGRILVSMHQNYHTGREENSTSSSSAAWTTMKDLKGMVLKQEQKLVGYEDKLKSWCLSPPSNRNCEVYERHN